MPHKIRHIETDIDVQNVDGIRQLRPAYSLLLADGSRVSLKPGMGMQYTWEGPRLCAGCEATVTDPRREYCYECFVGLASNDLCFVAPHRCHHHLGTCRDSGWAETVCMQPHTVYLSISSGPKVGITRKGREHRRWVGQGAVNALPIAAAPSRRAAGCLEHSLSAWLADSTAWRSLVSGRVKRVDLISVWRQLRHKLPTPADVAGEALTDAERAELIWMSEAEARAQQVSVEYPVDSFAPARVLGPDPDQQQVVGRLTGIIGSYLLFEHGVVAFSALSGQAVICDIGDHYRQVADRYSPQQSLF